MREMELKEKDKLFIGQKFNHLTAIKPVERPPNIKSKKDYWYFSCDCNGLKDGPGFKITDKYKVTSGEIVDCGCGHKERVHNASIEKGKIFKQKTYDSYIGLKKGKLTVIEMDKELNKQIKANIPPYVICKCSCNGKYYDFAKQINKTNNKFKKPKDFGSGYISIKISTFKNGEVQDCGCTKLEKIYNELQEKENKKQKEKELLEEKIEQKIIELKEKWLGKNIEGVQVLSISSVDKSLVKTFDSINKLIIYWDCRCLCGCNKIFVWPTFILEQRKLKANQPIYGLGCDNSIIKKWVTDKPNQYDLTNEKYGIGYDENGNKFIFDKEDYDRIKKYKWNGSKEIKSSRNKESVYFTTMVKGYELKLHWFVMGIYNEFGYDLDGNKEKLKEVNEKYNRKNNEALIDHINRKPMDNRKSNLRFTNSGLNKQNNDVYKNNLSGIIGVSFVNNKGWRSDITVNGKRKYLGIYINKEDAIKIRLLGEMIWFEDGYEPQREMFDKYEIKRWINIKGIGLVDLKEWGRIEENERIIFNVGRYWMNCGENKNIKDRLKDGEKGIKGKGINNSGRKLKKLIDNA